MKFDESKLVFALQDFCKDMGIHLDMGAQSHVLAVWKFKAKLNALLKDKPCPNSTPKSSTR